MPYLSASEVMIHYEEALYQVYAPLPLPLPLDEYSTSCRAPYHVRVIKSLFVWLSKVAF